MSLKSRVLPTPGIKYRSNLISAGITGLTVCLLWFIWLYLRLNLYKTMKQPLQGVSRAEHEEKNVPYTRHDVKLADYKD